RAGPQPSGNAAGLERPDLAERPGMGIVGKAFRLGGKCRHRQLTPVSVPPATPQLRPEMAEIERRVNRAVSLRQHRRDRVAEEMRVGDLPCAVAARGFKQTLVSRDMQPICHPLLAQPPDSAWNT